MLSYRELSAIKCEACGKEVERNTGLGGWWEFGPRVIDSSPWCSASPLKSGKHAPSSGVLKLVELHDKAGAAWKDLVSEQRFSTSLAKLSKLWTKYYNLELELETMKSSNARQCSVPVTYADPVKEPLTRRVGTPFGEVPLHVSGKGA